MSSLAVRTASEPGNAGQDKSSTVKMNGVDCECRLYYTYYKGAETVRAQPSPYNFHHLMRHHNCHKLREHSVAPPRPG